MRSLFIVFIVSGVATALNCYQGTQNASVALTGNPPACPIPSLSCLKSYDNATNMVVRSCQTTNCTSNGMLSPSGFCMNTSSQPFQTYCCCYNDGCNGAQAHSALILQFGWLVIPLIAMIAYSANNNK